MEGLPASLLTLLVLLSGSLLMPLLSGRLRVPSPVLLILFGIVVGPHAVDWVHEGEVVEFLYEMGFIVLMFLAGLEIDVNGLRKRGRGVLLSLFAVCATIFGFALLAAHLMGLSMVFGLALGAVSVGLPLAVLKETGALRSQLGQMVILLGSVGELLTLVGMTLLILGMEHGFSLELLGGMARLVGVLAIAGLSLRLLMTIAWWRPTSFSRLVDEDDGSEIGVRTALVLMVLFSTMAVLAGVESIVGAFLAGALTAFLLRGKEVLEEKLAVVGHGLFIPVFFIIVGLRFDVSAVTWHSLAIAAELFLVVFLVRMLPSLSLIRQGLSPREIVGTACLLSAPLTLMVAIGALGVQVGAISTDQETTILVLAMGTGLVFPILFRYLAKTPKVDQSTN